MSKHLTLKQRHYIYIEKDVSTKTAIAKKLGVAVSAITHEIKQNSSKHNYRYLQVQILYIKTKTSVFYKKPNLKCLQLLSLIQLQKHTHNATEAQASPKNSYHKCLQSRLMA